MRSDCHLLSMSSEASGSAHKVFHQTITINLQQIEKNYTNLPGNLMSVFFLLAVYFSDDSSACGS